MWKQIYEALKQLLLLTQQTERNRAEIKELRQELDDLTSAVERLAYEVRRSGENETHEREKLVLRLENKLLKFERRLHGKAEADPKGEE
jgi:predicted  nucleic acid-binding Zn-ribbon protein